jgi:ATP-dependent Clp protease ATP-binding subunit ClpA
MANKLERFTQRARRVLSLAQEEAERLQHSFIDTEHLLIALVREGNGVASQALRSLGIKLSQVQEIVESLNPPAPIRVNPQLDLSAGTKKVLELAVHESRRMGHDYIGTEHLLLGLMRQTTGSALAALKKLNINAEDVRREVRRALQERPAQPKIETETSETSEVGQAPDTPAQMILEMLGKGKLTPEQAATMMEQSTIKGLAMIQVSLLDVVRSGRASAEQALQLLRPLQAPLSPLFIGVDMAREIQITVTSDDKAETEFTLTAAQFQDVMQKLIAALRADKTGTIVDHPISANQRIRVKVDKKQGGTNPDAEV